MARKLQYASAPVLALLAGVFFSRGGAASVAASVVLAAAAVAAIALPLVASRRPRR